MELTMQRKVSRGDEAAKKRPPATSRRGLARRMDIRSARRIIVRNANPLLRSSFSLIASSFDGLAIMLAALVSGSFYHAAVYGSPPVLEPLIQMGGMAALIVIIANIVRGDYAIAKYLTSDGHVLRQFKIWNMALVGGTVFAFLTKTGDIFSRGTVLAFYTLGFLFLAASHIGLVGMVRHLSRNGPMLARRVFLVGSDTNVLGFISRHWPMSHGVQIVGVANLSPRALNEHDEAESHLDRELQQAVVQARRLDVDDVFLLMNRSREDIIDTAINSFLTMPASIHLASEQVLERFQDARIARIGAIASLSLVRRPLTLPEIIIKRGFDIVASLIGMVLLVPLVVLVAISIKIDSAGPVFFLQRRYGFNQKPFRIIKFRTMTTMDDGAIVQQASKDDQRITRVGRILRRYNIDELPQLLNVLIGDMSLVGPRPHALAHDHHFMSRIALYARRHNVKPGITGWAQVSGYRGETDTDEKMRGRIEHDLYYIDNWSLLLDLTIIMLTIFSPKAYRNAH
ncbi:MAG: undecaprenyl-phosphate glucose phosphotransferase [Beijerinckiaceae bacterium]